MYFIGTAGDSLGPYHNGVKFSTHDVDNDSIDDFNCAQNNHGGWWFTACHNSHLNGEYLEGHHTKVRGTGVNWHPFKGHQYSYKIAEMKVGHHGS